jgi:hypothetical protein
VNFCCIHFLVDVFGYKKTVMCVITKLLINLIDGFLQIDVASDPWLAAGGDLAESRRQDIADMRFVGGMWLSFLGFFVLFGLVILVLTLRS